MAPPQDNVLQRRVTLGTGEHDGAADPSGDEQEDGDLSSEELRSCLQALTQDEFGSPIDDDSLAAMELPPEAQQGGAEDDEKSSSSPDELLLVPNKNKRQQVNTSTNHTATAKKQRKITDSFPQQTSSKKTVPQTIKESGDFMIFNTRTFKKGDTWTHRKMNGYYFTNNRLLNVKEDGAATTTKAAVCVNNVHIELWKTFIGEKEANRVAEEWTKAGKTDANLAHCATTLPPILDKGRVFLKDLKDKQESESPNPELIYVSGLKETFGVGFTRAYRFKQEKGIGTSSCRTVQSPPRKPVLLDLFAGGGLMGLGLKRAGFDVKYMIESNPAAVATLQLNNPDGTSGIFGEDAHSFLEKAKSKMFPLHPRRGDVDHIHGSPPCCAVSRANRNGGKNDDYNNSLTYLFVEYVRFYRPKTVTMENVPGILDKKKVHLLRKVMADLMLLDYQVRICVVDAGRYGDPQKRERVILFAAQKGLKLPDYPKETHGPNAGGKFVTVKEALCDLEGITPYSRQPGQLDKIEFDDGTTIWNHNDDCTRLTKDPEKLVADEQAKTLRRQNAIKHYSLEREVTARERARLQGVPDDYILWGTTAEQNDQIGNGVPVNLAYAVGLSAIEPYRYCTSHY